MSDTAATTEQTTAQPGDTIRAKWLMDGATTLADAADRLDAEATRLRSLHAQGWTLTQPISDDYGFLRDPSGNAGVEDTDADDEGEDVTEGDPSQN